MVEKVGGGVGGDICFKTPVGGRVEHKFLSVGGIRRGERGGRRQLLHVQ